MKTKYYIPTEKNGGRMQDGGWVNTKFIEVRNGKVYPYSRDNNFRESTFNITKNLKNNLIQEVKIEELALMDML